MRSVLSIDGDSFSWRKGYMLICADMNNTISFYSN
jgi:hypothetical protein